MQFRRSCLLEVSLHRTSWGLYMSVLSSEKTILSVLKTEKKKKNLCTTMGSDSHLLCHVVVLWRS